MVGPYHLNPLTEGRLARLRCSTWNTRSGGRILDGRHRYRACGELGVAMTFVDFEGTAAQAKLVAAGLNLTRRHDSPEEVREARSRLAIEMRAEGDEHAGDRGRLGVSQPTVLNDLIRGDKGLSPEAVQPESGDEPNPEPLHCAPPVEKVRGRDGKMHPATKGRSAKPKGSPNPGRRASRRRWT